MSLTGSSWFGGGNSFTGILDEVSQTGYYGHSSRRLTKDFLITSPIIRLRRSSDNAEMDFSYSADSNCLDANSLETGGATNIVTWMGSDTIYVVTSYEQGGSGLNLTQSTAANQPIFNKTGFYWNGYKNGATSKYLTRTFGSTITYYSVNAVSNTVNSTVTYYDGIIQDLTPEPLLANSRLSWRSPPFLEFSKVYDPAGKYAWKCYWDGTYEYLTIGTKTFSRIATKSAPLGSINWGISVASTSNDCPKYELIYRFGYDASDVVAIEANQKDYYGI